MSNGEMIAKKPKNNYVSNGNIDFDGIINGAKEREKEQTKAFLDNMQEKAAAERERNEEITNLFKKAYDKQQETRKKKMKDEQKAAEEKASEDIRKKYNDESAQEWNESKTDKAYKELLNNLTKK